MSRLEEVQQEFARLSTAWKAIAEMFQLPGWPAYMAWHKEQRDLSQARLANFVLEDSDESRRQAKSTAALIVARDILLESEQTIMADFQMRAESLRKERSALMPRETS